MRWAGLLGLALWCLAGAAEPPALTLAEDYQRGLDVAEYWVSEKLDGVRGYWTGERLITRGGHPVNPPDWFVAGFPDVPLDGELWLGRGRFAETSGIVRTEEPVDAEWQRMRFMVFDLPAHEGRFTERLAALKALLGDLDIDWLQPVAQFRVADHAALRRRLEAVVDRGGEGLMLRRADSRHESGRSDDLLKVKVHQDAEARVIRHLPGDGKYADMMGSLLVETPDGRRFRLGTGFTDEQRADPPPVGSWVTYRFNGFTTNGLPRFARFLRVRPGYTPP